jgi:hypothetical protein
MKKLFIIALSLYATALVGCGQSNSGSSSSVSATGVCSVGTWNGSACVDSSGNAIVTTTMQYYDYNKLYGSDGSTASGAMTVNSSTLAVFLKEALGVCDQTIYGYNYGYASCSNWTSGAFWVSFSIDSSLKPQIRFQAGPTYQYFNGMIGYPSGSAVYNPLILSSQTTYNLINNSQGFEIRSYGGAGTVAALRRIQIQVVSGALGSNTLSYAIYYPVNGNAVTLATGTFTRYQ